MKVTEQELIDIWRYFQYCCLPSLVAVKCAYFDYIGDIQKETKFYKFGIKRDINQIGKYLDSLPNKLMSINSKYKNYITIFSNNIEELFEEDEEELHKAIYITLRNGKLQHLECLSALYYIEVMIQVAIVVFKQCCNNIKAFKEKDPTTSFNRYNLQDTLDKWDSIIDSASTMWGYDKYDKKHPRVNLNNPRCIKAINNIRNKLLDINSIRIAMRKSYPWSPDYQEGVPYEQSNDYLIVHSNNN